MAKPAQKAMTGENDPRITKLGRFLRKTRIDELPQMWNILLGQMSWIGPRPEALELSRWYQQEIPFYDYRHIVLPGITGEHFDQPTVDSLVRVLADFDPMAYDPAACRSHAQTFSAENFRNKLLDFVEQIAEEAV